MSDSQIHALPLFGRGEGHPSWLPTEEGVNYWNRDKKQVPDMPRNIRSWKTGPPYPVCCCLSFPITLRPSPMPLPPRGTDGEHGRKNFHSPSGSTRGPGPLPPAQRGRSPATGRNTRIKDRRQSPPELGLGRQVALQDLYDKCFPKAVRGVVLPGTPAIHTIFLFFPVVLSVPASVACWHRALHSPLHSLVCCQLINPSICLAVHTPIHPIFIKYLLYAKYHKMVIALKVIGGRGTDNK